MKKLLLFLLFPLAVHAQQPLNVDTINYTYTGIESVDGVPAHILQSRARLFVADYVNTIKAETKVDDADGGDLLVNDFLRLAIKMPGDKDSSILGQLNFAFKLVVKDGKYKYTCYGVNHQQDNNVLGGGWLTNIKPACGTFAMSMEKWRQVRASGNNYVLAFIAALKAAMKSSEIDPSKPDF